MAEVTTVTARRWLHRVIAVVLLALTLAVAGCARPGAVPGATVAPVRQLDSVGALREAFNADAGATRLVLLISPT